MRWALGPANTGQNFQNMSSLLRHLQKTSHRNRKLFFSILTRRLAESVEGLNSSLALASGDLWPTNCEPIYWLARSLKGVSQSRPSRHFWIRLPKCVAGATWGFGLWIAVAGECLQFSNRLFCLNSKGSLWWRPRWPMRVRFAFITLLPLLLLSSRSDVLISRAVIGNLTIEVYLCLPSTLLRVVAHLAFHFSVLQIFAEVLHQTCERKAHALKIKWQL